MAGFPPEVLAEICQHVENDKDTLKALRLANRFLGVEASKYLYKTLLVYQTPRSWKKLHSVSQCQHLNHYTEELEVATLEYLPVYANFEAWKSATPKARRIPQESSDNLAGAALVLREADLYRSYCEWQKGEQMLLNAMMASRDGALLYLSHSIGVVTFPNLHTVKSLGAHELWPLTPQTLTDRRAREIAVLESVSLDTRTCKGRSAHLCFAIEVFRLSNPLGTSIVSLELNRYREFLAEQTFNIPALRTLRKLRLSFASGPEEDIISTMGSSWNLAPWLRNARELRSIRIVTQDAEKLGCYPVSRNVVRLFNDAPWPKLRVVYVTETFLTSKYLLLFLEKHVHGLETLWIKEPVVKKHYWQRLADKIRTMFSTTKCDLWLDDPHPEAEHQIFLEDYDDNNFFVTDLHPNFPDLNEDERHEYSDPLEDD